MSSSESVDDLVPRLRGMLHVVACPLTVAAGLLLAWQAPSARLALSVLLAAGGYAAIFGTSGLFHRVRWSEAAHRRVRHLDHAAIFFGIATIYTGIWFAALEGAAALLLLVFVWVAAVAGTLSRVWVIDVHSGLHAAQYVGIGGAGFVVVPVLWASMGPLAASLMVAGGVAMILGALAFAIGRPNPIPGWIGFHEVFHLGTVVGATLQITSLGVYALG